VRKLIIDSVHSFTPLSGLVALVLVTGCGGSPSSPPAVPNNEASGSLASRAVAPSTPVANAAAADDEADPNESSTPIVLTPLFTKHNPPKFPKATIGDHECWQGLELSGTAKVDYDNLVSHCGTPTGVVEYAHPATGHLHHDRDKRDEFKLQLAGGYCYRYFAVADSSIDDLDILVERYGGDMVGDDQTKGPVAIIQSDKPWCMDDDIEYDLNVAVKGEGHGNYVVGVYARPK
jgi:hypothetical protein